MNLLLARKVRTDMASVVVTKLPGVKLAENDHIRACQVITPSAATEEFVENLVCSVHP